MVPLSFPFQSLAVLLLHRPVAFASLRAVRFARHLAIDQRPAAHHAVQRFRIRAPVRLPIMFHRVAPRLASFLHALELFRWHQVEQRELAGGHGIFYTFHLRISEPTPEPSFRRW